MPAEGKIAPYRELKACLKRGKSELTYDKCKMTNDRERKVPKKNPKCGSYELTTFKDKLNKHTLVM